MTPVELIAQLDAALREAGTPARLIRPLTGSAVFALDCLITMRGYNPTEIVPGSDISQQDQQFVLSPTALLAAGWPGLPVRANNPLVPRNGDRIVANGASSTIQAASGVYVGGVLVRIDGRTRGDS